MRCTDEQLDALTSLARNQEDLAVLEARQAALPERENLHRLEEQARHDREQAAQQRITHHREEREVQRLQQELDKLTSRAADDRMTLESTTDVETRKDLTHDLRSTDKRVMELRRRLDRAHQTTAIFQHSAASTPVDEGTPSGATPVDEADVQVAREQWERAHNALDADIRSTQHRIEAARSKLPAEVLDAYDEQLADHGVGAAFLRGTTCQGCYMELDPLTLKTFREAPKGEIRRCPECNVLLLTRGA